MTGLHRTNLTTSQKIECAAAAVARQGEHGARSALSREFNISRPTVYAAGAAAQAVLEEHFTGSLLGGAALKVRVDEQQLRRAVVALRVVAPNSIRAIENLLPVLYPRLKVSYGKIQGLLAEAEDKAAALNREEDLSAIDSAALDEMFSQGEPVLAGVDLDHGYLFGLQLSETRDGPAWAQVLRQGQAQGLSLSVVVKDAALGIEAGVSEVFPQAEQRDDCFHALYEMNKVRRSLEQKAYAAISTEVEQEQKLGRIRAKDQDKREQQRRQLVWARRCCEEAMAQFDEFEEAMRQVREAMEWVDLKTGQLRDAHQVQTQVEEAAKRMAALKSSRAQQVARYVRNRAPGLALAVGALRTRLEELGEQYCESAVALGCVFHRVLRELERGQRRGDKHKQFLLGVYARLHEMLGNETQELLERIGQLLEGHHRASSAIEGFNAALRPFLYVHKGVTQSFLELFRAYYNLRTRRWGRHRGTSAHQCLTGEPVADWLSLLGYPPSGALVH